MITKYADQADNHVSKSLCTMLKFRLNIGSHLSKSNQSCLILHVKSQINHLNDRIHFIEKDLKHKIFCHIKSDTMFKGCNI